MSKINIMLHDKVLAEIENKPTELSKESDNFEYNLGLLTHMVKEALYFEPTMPRPYKYVLVHPDFLPSISNASNFTIFGLSVLFTKDLPCVGAEII